MLGALLIDGAAEGEAGTEDLLDGSLEGLGHGLFLDDLGDLLDLLESEVALVGHVLDFLSVTLVVAELLDKQGGGRGVDGDFSSSVLALELDHHSDALPLAAFLDDVLTHLLSVQTQGAELGSEGGCGAGLSAENFDVD